LTQLLRPLIVGAGPAGIRAAEVLAKAGIRPILVDEAPLGGGQIYRQRLVPDERSPRALYGSEAKKATALHKTLAALADRLDYWPQALVWNLAGNVADIAMDGHNRHTDFTHLLLATGATDRVLPFAGWTVPGVFSLGGAQVALKSQGCAIGERVVFLGSGPLLYLVAWQYMNAGAKVEAVLDTAPLRAKLNLLRGLALQPGVILRGMRYAAELVARGVPVRYGVEPLRVEGDARVTAVVWQERGTEKRITCDSLAFGLGLRSESQLADLAGCRFIFDTRDRAWRPERDVAGRTSVAGVYIAGDGAGIAGADAAELAGERAGWAVIEEAGLPVDKSRIRVLEQKSAALDRFRSVLASAFPFPDSWAEKLAGDVVLCRCEEIAVADARVAAGEMGVIEINRLKALTRIGMGRCQGRMCGTSAAEVLAASCGSSVDAVGRLRAQAPIKPLPLDLAAEEDAA
jgi:NADPH-dependent 2,4-dienoyl-CoA reductase/sulfur reductase-like enzyme